MEPLPPLTESDAPRPEPAPPRPAALGHIKSAAAVALHMHQPLIPGGGVELSRAGVISNLQFMLESGSDGDRYNAQVYHQCYRRTGELVRTAVDAGQAPRVMLEYSGTLLHGLERMGLTDVFE